MHISFVIPDLKGGGAQKMMINLANEFSHQGHQVDLVLLNEGGTYQEHIDPKVTVHDFAKGRSIKSIWTLARYIRKSQPDIMMSALFHVNIVTVIAWMLSCTSKTRLIVTERNHLSRRLTETTPVHRFVLKNLVKFSYPRADHVVGISNGVCDDLRELIQSESKEFIQTIYNPVVTDDFENLVKQDVPSMFPDDGGVRLVASGRLVLQKDYPTMLKALAEYRKHYGPAHLVILGDGPLRAELQALVRELKMEEHVTFAGFVTNPLAVMKQADIFIVSSVWEGFCNVIVEALYCGLKVVSTDCPSGPSEILKEGEYGALCPMGDAKAISLAIEKVAMESEEREKQIARAMEFTAKRKAQEFEDLFSHVIGAVEKNILLVISKFPPEYSGPGVRIPRLYDWMKKQGDDFNLQVLCNGVEQTKSEVYDYKDVPVRRIVAGWIHCLFAKFEWLDFVPQRLRQALVYQSEFFQTFAALMFRKQYKDLRFMHVAGHSGGTAAALLWAKIRGIPVLMELVTEHARHVQKILFIFKVRPPENSIVIALTEKAKQECMKLGLAEDKIWCRPNPIDEERFHLVDEQKMTLKNHLTPFSQDKIIISNVAKMMPQKNQFLILKVLTHLPDNFVAVIAGPFINEGPLYERDKKYVDDMKNYIKENDLQTRVHLVLDFVPADQYMKLADIYAMPAWNEGFGTPMIEAMGCGVPVVANAGETAFQEWIIDGQNGFLCDIEKPQKWAQAIEKASKFPKQQCQEMSDDIRKKAGQEAIYNHYVSLINNLI